MLSPLLCDISNVLQINISHPRDTIPIVKASSASTSLNNLAKNSLKLPLELHCGSPLLTISVPGLNVGNISRSTEAVHQQVSKKNEDLEANFRPGKRPGFS